MKILPQLATGKALCQTVGDFNARCDDIEQRRAANELLANDELRHARTRSPQDLRAARQQIQDESLHLAQESLDLIDQRRQLLTDCLAGLQTRQKKAEQALEKVRDQVGEKLRAAGLGPENDPKYADAPQAKQRAFAYTVNQSEPVREAYVAVTKVKADIDRTYEDMRASDELEAAAHQQLEDAARQLLGLRRSRETYLGTPRVAQPLGV